MRTKIIGRGIVLAAALLVALPGSASAAPTLTMTSPEDGATVSRGQTPSITLAGGVEFETPEPTTRTMYLRRTECDTAAGFLSDTSGANGGNACEGFPAFALTATGLIDYSHEFSGSTGAVQLPLTVDASRNLTGQINFRSNTDTPAWQHFEVDIRLGNTFLARQSVEDALPSTTSWRTINLNVPIPAGLDKVDINDLSVTVHYRRSTATWIELNSPASFIQVPAYTASFNRRVETRIGTTGNFTNATLNEDLNAWSRTIATPANGSYFVQARAVQGTQASPIVQHVLHVSD